LSGTICGGWLRFVTRRRRDNKSGLFEPLGGRFRTRNIGIISAGWVATTDANQEVRQEIGRLAQVDIGVGDIGTSACDGNDGQDFAQ
jgi:hypothetical protein